MESELKMRKYHEKLVNAGKDMKCGNHSVVIKEVGGCRVREYTYFSTNIVTEVECVNPIVMTDFGGYHTPSTKCAVTGYLKELKYIDLTIDDGVITPYGDSVLRDMDNKDLASYIRGKIKGI